MKILASLTVPAALLLLAPVDARADATPAATAATSAPAEGAPNGFPALEISLKAGGHFPQVTNKLGTSFDGILKVGYGVALDHRLQLFIEGGYTQPTHETSATDPRLAAAGADYKTTLTVKTLSTNLGLAYWIPAGSSFVNPYAGAAFHVAFVKSVVEGSGGGQSFGENDETSTQYGGLAFGGVGLRLGPGLLLGELRFTYAGISEKVTGSANIGALSALIGYGLML
jgi:hypothetical protein